MELNAPNSPATIEITQDENNALVVITTRIMQLESEKKAVVDAQKAIVLLLESKYNAKLNSTTGIFEHNKPEE
uniref:Uncharacterized protein n=1 Tax=viral metagenome TaxID=1070528 RepID=A0A6M3L7J1_9ZZZZ